MTMTEAGAITDARGAVGTTIHKRRWIRWTKKLKAAFLDRLAETCDVAASARTLGLDPTTIHHLRRRDAAFAADWEVALDAGYVMIETRLVGHVLSGGARGDAIDEAGGHTVPIDVEAALRVLSVRESRAARLARGEARRGGAKPQRAPRAETDAVILRQLRALSAAGEA